MTCASGFVNDMGCCKVPNCTGVACGGSDGAGGLCVGANGTCTTAGQHCNSSGQCVCDGTSCAGCCDNTGQCHTSSTATCGVNGAACSPCADCCSPSGACGTTWYPDNDLDMFGDIKGATVCSPTKPAAPAANYVTDHTDCCDRDPNAKPNSTFCSTVKRGCGDNFDYDCNGTSAPVGCTSDLTGAQSGTLDSTRAIDCAGTGAGCTLSGNSCVGLTCTGGPGSSAACATACNWTISSACGSTVGFDHLLCEQVGNLFCQNGSTSSGPGYVQACN